MLGLQDAFTADELKMPFVIVKMVPDPNDPLMRELIMRQGIGAEATLFPPSLQPLAIAPPQGAAGRDLPDLPDPCAPETKTPPQQTTTAPPPPETTSPRAELIARINALYLKKIKGGKRDPSKPALETYDEATLKQIETHMQGMPDAVPDI